MPIANLLMFVPGGVSPPRGAPIGGGGGGGGWLLTNSCCRLGKKELILSHVRAHRGEWLLSAVENTPAESITSSMFFSDSGMASYCNNHYLHCTESATI